MQINPIKSVNIPIKIAPGVEGLIMFMYLNFNVISKYETPISFFNFYIFSISFF